ncbi:MAG: hypothetical protein IH599_03540, partial [Bacteroidales bacterium]|nr:hypothetical protein [Bacteroidales bacterium]
VTIEVRLPMANAGPDRGFCGVGTFQLGTTILPDVLYSWEPTAIITDSTNPRPYVTVYPGIEEVFLTIVDTITGCTDLDTVIFTELQPVEAAANDDDTVCAIGDVAVFIGDGDNEIGPQYIWFPVTGLDDPTSPWPVATPSVTTTYTMIATYPNSQGCDVVDQITLFVKQPGLLPVNAGPDHLICPNESVEIGPQPDNDLHYAWSPPNGLDDPDEALTWATPPVGSMTYYLTVSDYESCLQGEDMVLIEWVDMGQAGTFGHTICQGDSVLIGPVALSGLSYQWVPPIGLSSFDTAQVFAKPLTSQAYTLYVENDDCESSQQYWVLVNPPPVADAGADITACGGGSTIGSPALAGHSYQWSPPTGLNNPNTAQPIATPTVLTEYVLTVTSMATGCTSSDTVLVHPFPVANAGPDQAICPGESVIIGLTGNPSYSYSWSPSSSLDDPGSSRPTATPPVTTLYTLSVTDGSCTQTDEVLVEVKQPGILSITPVPPLCKGECVELSFNQTNGPFTSLVWSPASALSNAYVTNPTFCGNASTQI